MSPLELEESRMGISALWLVRRKGKSFGEEEIGAELKDLADLGSLKSQLEGVPSDEGMDDNQWAFEETASSQLLPEVYAEF
ncbi:hypothetical protein E2562_035875 [Oryza meyeriana var. granulata]|uniref:Uncharacterized protein n=1 Tax=Oryza meyeriana var. granulata TaxID=110450 RepID=A0A6G1ESV4_9ORYZ|nr:hypothetical protein E2562_035875 [Oryza meyeriana var. granulata]